MNVPLDQNEDGQAPVPNDHTALECGDTDDHEISKGDDTPTVPTADFGLNGFRQRACETVHYVAHYLETIGQRKVFPDVLPGYLASMVPTEAPEYPESWEDIMGDVERVVMPGASSPACTELEVVMMDWLARILRLPDFFMSGGKGGGVISGSASDSTLVALFGARNRSIKAYQDENPTASVFDAASKLIGYYSDQLLTCHTIWKPLLLCRSDHFGKKGSDVKKYKDVDWVIKSFNVDPAYLKHQHQGKVPDFRHWHIPLGRKFRSLKLWFLFRYFGVEALRNYIRNHISLAQHFESLVRADNRFEIVHDVRMALVCFRLMKNNDLTRQLYQEIENDGRIHLTPSEFHHPEPMFFIRFAVCYHSANMGQIQHAFDVICELTTRLLRRPSVSLSQESF
ncbi:Dopa decarboxylase [Fasciola gigantica]|uniref:Aromatic-L-amino-acid decarboxylase n=1 Tax=Fasciola gigantica TaxID=46835 RepID=A0A504YKT2_FASGI|nr:Dopa decarboxylase [Fasciola gigantica]